MKISKILITLSITAGIAFSCNRENSDINVPLDQENLRAEANADFVTDSDVDLAMDFTSNFENTTSLRTSSTAGQLGAHPDYPCATISVTSTNGTFPKVIIVDFGTGCTDKRGITRKGKIIFTVSNPLFVSGATVTISHQDFYVEGRKIEGEIKLKNLTTDLKVPTFSKEVTNGKITNEDGAYFTFSSSRKYKMIEGVSTPNNIWDDAFEVYEGNRNVNRSNGTYFTSSIKTPLLKRNSCRFISKGSVTLKGTKVDGTLDFGNGDCDNLATFTDVNGKVHQITLRK